MRSLITRSGALLIAIVIAGCATVDDDMNTTTDTTTPPSNEQMTVPETVPMAVPDNPLLAEWGGSYGGVPPFDQVKVEDFEPALEYAMAENLANVERIAADPAPATFDNTIAALERASRRLDRASASYGVWGSTMNGPEFQAVETRMEPRLAAFFDKINQNEALFRRIETVYNSPDKANLTPEQQRLAWLYHNNFVRAGARLDGPAKARVSEINQKLSGLFTQFSQNVLADEND